MEPESGGAQGGGMMDWELREGMRLEQIGSQGSITFDCDFDPMIRLITFIHWLSIYISVFDNKLCP